MKKSRWIWRDDAQKIINQFTNWQNSQWLRMGAPRKINLVTTVLQTQRNKPI